MGNDNETSKGPTGFDALNEIGRRLFDLFGSVDDTLRNGGKERSHQFTIRAGRRTLSGVAGYSVRGVTPRERSERPEGRERASEKPELEAAREPLVDVFDEPSEVLVTAELPGVGAEEVTATVERDRLRIETTGRQRFRKHVALPCNLDGVTPVIRLSNGILEIRLQKPTEPTAS